MANRNPLTVPRGARHVQTPHYDPEAFGRFAEAIARQLGTARFLVLQTAVCIAWVLVNITSPSRYDPYPFILLTLALSLQAAYAAPLILLAQSRQEDRDRNMTEEDRVAAARNQDENDWQTRELASIRLQLGGLPGRDDIEKLMVQSVPQSAFATLQDILDELQHLREAVEARPTLEQIRQLAS